MWGSSPAFVEMQKSQKPIISKRTIEWESLLRVAVLQQQALGDGASTMTDETQLWLMLTPTKDLDRDGHRKLFVAWLLKDIGKYPCTFSYNSPTDAVFQQWGSHIGRGIKVDYALG
ncbi:hypothetical protein H0H93_003227 [Arthromyces matolae]|nr:hypothetical protein H0H93_003227 [Arthromyces matolae]